MTIFYSSLLLFVVLLGVFNWFYLQELKTASIRIGLGLPTSIIRLFAGIVFGCFFVSLSTMFTLFVTLLSAK